jgi:hypothetical protein
MMSEFQDREATYLWHELKYVYPELAPPDERTEEEKKLQAERDIDDLFGPEEREEENADQGTD